MMKAEMKVEKEKKMQHMNTEISQQYHSQKDALSARDRVIYLDAILQVQIEALALMRKQIETHNDLTQAIIMIARIARCLMSLERERNQKRVD